MIIKIKTKKLKNGSIKYVNEYPTNVPIGDLVMALHASMEEFKTIIKSKLPTKEEFECNSEKTLSDLFPKNEGV